jgi:pimeloyl-ACP methyl ester carboxylesterase
MPAALLSSRFCTGRVPGWARLFDGTGRRATLGRHLAYLMSYEPVERIEKIGVPTLIVRGDGDRARPVLHAAMFHARIRGSVLRVHRGIGHFPREEATAATAADVPALLRALR